MKKKGKTGRKRSFWYLVLAFALAVSPGGCGKGQEAEKEMSETPIPILSAAADVPAENPQDTAAPSVAVDSPQADGFSATLPLVTPVPPEAVTEVAGSIAPGQYPVVDGSTATLPLSQALYSYATGEDEEAAQKAVVHTKTTNSYYRLYRGEADLLIVYEPPQEIIDRMQSETLLIKPVGLDALVFMANEGNPVQSLTKQQLVDIYSGQVSNWAEVGGNDQRLLAFQRPEGSGSQTLMQKLVMGDVAMEECDNAFRYYTMSDILEGMISYSGEANTLGYSVFYYANFMYSLPGLRFMGVDGVMPSTQSIYDGSYPFVNAFYAVIRPDEPEDSNARRLFDWLTGEEGQQMVLDLGYVPVKMPAGTQIAQKDPGREGEMELTPVQKLEAGQHYIFVQQEVSPSYNDYGDIWIFDENWNCTASFKAASCSVQGVTDARYLSIYCWEAKKEYDEDGEEEWIYPVHVYDLVQNEFVDFWGKEVTILNHEKGHFEYYEDYDNIKIIDRDGNVLLEGIEMGEGGGMIYRHQDYYIVSYWGKADSVDRIQEIYDLDFRLQSILYYSKEDMPPVGERMDGVGYVWEETGCLLSWEGRIVLSPEIFLAAFGNGSDTECTVARGTVNDSQDDAANRLYRVDYAGEVWYVDAACNAYFKEGADHLAFRDPGRADRQYYMVQTEEETKYFASDGSRLAPEFFDGEPVYSAAFADGSYVLAGKSEWGYVVEMAVPKDDYHQGWQNEPVGTRCYEIECLEPYVVTIKGCYEDGQGKTQEEIAVFYKDQVAERFAAQKVNIERIMNRRTGQYEDAWLVTMYGGQSQTIMAEGKEKKFYTFAVVRDGKLSFTTPIPGSYRVCHGGYLQVDAGSYTYVYDYDGNQIIKAYNRLLAEE